MLKVQNLKKYFGGVKAVDDCSFEVEKGTITALIGPNGAGKSTVFNIVSGILKADEGQVNFDDVDIANLKPEKISNLGISRLFQQSKLFNNISVRENLLLALDNEDTKFWKNFLGLNKIGESKGKKIREMLKLVNLEKFENTSAKDLSYGQKRLIELIRTILNPHKFLMLDEPVAGVNPKLREKISDILLQEKAKPAFAEATAGKAILLIEHDMNFTLNVADRVIVLEKGKVIAEGKPEEIKNNPEVLEAYLGE